MSPAAPITAGLWGSVFSGFLPALLTIVGIGVLLVGLLAVYQTRRWPRQETVEVKKAAPQEETAPPTTPATAAATPALRPTTTTKAVQIHFPGIDEAHPDVWSTDAPLVVAVRVDPGQLGPDRAVSVRLSTHRKGRTSECGTVGVDDEGIARFEVPFAAKGEHDLVAESLVDGRPSGQAVRAIRIASYRDEVVETFEDFVAWAASHYPFVDRRMTAREFVDRYADGRPGTPVPPLDTIVDIYELANYSEHPVDRRRYIELVDAFLELEEAGALEGPGEA